MTTIKILGIGNSFTEDALEQNLYELAQEVGIELVIGVAYHAGWSLQEHWESANNGEASIYWRKVNNTGWNSRPDKTLEWCIEQESWDYIAFQQVSDYSGIVSSYEPYLTNLISYVKSRVSNPNAKYGFYMTWAYPQFSKMAAFANYDNDQITMYEAIANAVQTIMQNHQDLDFLVPVGTAIQNARTTVLGDSMNRDDHHLSKGTGRYTAACTWLEAITGVSPVGLNYHPKASFKRWSGGENAVEPIGYEMAAICQMAAHHAVQTPYAITNMEDYDGEGTAPTPHSDEDAIIKNMELNIIPSKGKFGTIATQLNRNFDIIQVGFSEIQFSVSKNKGMFSNSAALQATIPSPKAGDWALVGNNFPAAIYVCVTDGTWIDSGNTYSGDNVDFNDYVKKVDDARDKGQIWGELSDLLYDMAKKASGIETEEDGVFFTDPSGRVFMKYTNTQGLDANKVSDHLKGLIGGGSGGASPIEEIEEDVVSIVTNSSGASAVLWSNKYGFNVNKVNYYTLDKIKNGYVKDMNAWAELGCGMFIHWGVYSYLAGHFTGTNIHGESVDAEVEYNAEWIFKFMEIPDNTYRAYQSYFTASSWDADAIAKMAHNCGLKYIVLTAKHHEGFCLFNSTNANWTIATSGASGKDPIQQLKDACEKYGLKFGVYFSQSKDWMANGGFDQGWKNNNVDPYSESQHQNYITMTIKVINEMINRYHPYMLWYDTPDAPDQYADRILASQLQDYPEVIVNWRLKSNFSTGDFATGENSYFEGDRNTWKYAENCYTINGSWGYWASKDNVESTYSVARIIGRSFLESKCRNQNILLNISPKASGEVSSVTKGLFAEISAYVQKYGTFNDTFSTNINTYPSWGRLLKKGNLLKAYVCDMSSTIRIDGVLTNFIKSVRVYDAANEYSASNYSIISEYSLQVTNIPTNNNHTPAVVEVEFDNDIVSESYSNILYNGNLTLKALAFNAKGAKITTTSWDTQSFEFGSWTSSAHWIETTFMFNGTSGTYKISAVLPSGGNSVVATAKITNNTSGTSATATFTRSATTSSQSFTLTNGVIYTLKITHDGTHYINLSSVTFVKQ